MSTPQWKLRRLASRVIRVLERRSKEFPSLAAYEPTAGAKAREFMAQYDAVNNYATTWRKELGEGKSAVDQLATRIRAWLPLLARDVLGFDTSSYADRPAVPDDVIEDGERLVAFVEGEDGAQHNLPYAKSLSETLAPFIDKAVKEWGEAESADVQYQRLLATTRQSAAALDAELISLRRTLAQVLGRRDKDYQKLRVERASQRDEDDDSKAPPPPSAVSPAKPDDALPSFG